jgi:hypothetical protein
VGSNILEEDTAHSFRVLEGFRVDCEVFVMKNCAGYKETLHTLCPVKIVDQ